MSKTSDDIARGMERAQREREACFDALRTVAANHPRAAVQGALQAIFGLYGTGPVPTQDRSRGPTCPGEGRSCDR